MHPSVHALTQILSPPPADTAGVYQVQFPPPLPDSGGDRFDWADLTTRTGWRYPADYRSFLETYGAGGSICNNTLSIESPPPAGAQYWPERPGPYPAPNGICVWGYTDAGDTFYWRCTDPDPDRWTVMLEPRDDYNGQTQIDYPLAMVEFLTRLLLDPSVQLPLGVNLHTGSPRTWDGWRAFDLQIRAEYPTFNGIWTPHPDARP